MPITVNLDAMILREDFEAESGPALDQSRGGNELYLTSLSRDGRLATMRKPAFQRDTSAWTPKIVLDFIKSVVDGDVIPAVIMWRSPLTGKLFVIDGAHRLSALIGWIHDDYGDREDSQRFFGHVIDAAQMHAADVTRKLIDSEVGPYRRLRAYAQQPVTAPDELALKRSRRIMNDPIFIQWVVGDAEAAEKSFLRINSTAVAIDDTEKTLISTRKKPSGLAARALIRSGTGYEYWSGFSEPVKGKIRDLGAEIYNQLIKPIVEYPIVSVDLPVPDRGYSANSSKTIYDLVTYLNPETKQKKGTPTLIDDNDGSQTIAYLEKVKTSTARVFGRQHPGSLALPPGVYCYGMTGKFIPKAFIGAVGFVADLEARDKFFSFTENRAAFENFLLNHRDFMNQISSSQGSGGKRGIPAVIALYNLIYQKLADMGGETEIINAIQEHQSLSFLASLSQIGSGQGTRFSTEDKIAVLLRQSLASELICPVCNARLYRKDRSHDHDKRLADGGRSSQSNLQLTHPYCNTGYKEKLVHAKAS